MMRYIARGRLTRESRVRRTIVAAAAVAIVVMNLFLLKTLSQFMGTTEAVPADETANRPGRKKPRVVFKEPQPRQQTAYEQMFQEIGARYRLDWRILEALAYRESHMNFRATGAARDMGLMQIIPSTWNEWAPKVGVHDPFDPYSNILVATAYLAFVREVCIEFGYADPHCMLVGYNWGPGQLAYFLDRGGTWDQIPVAQRDYALSILRLAKARTSGAPLNKQLYASIPVE
jgi:soluble lytic murein transglycosylase-like protein